MNLKSLVSLFTVSAFFCNLALPAYASSTAQWSYVQNVSLEHRSLFEKGVSQVVRALGKMNAEKREAFLTKTLHVLNRGEHRIAHMSAQKVERRLKKSVTRAENQIASNDELNQDFQSINADLTATNSSNESSSPDGDAAIQDAMQKLPALNATTPKKRAIQMIEFAKNKISERLVHHSKASARAPAQILMSFSAPATLAIYAIAILIALSVIALAAGIIIMVVGVLATGLWFAAIGAIVGVSIVVFVNSL